MGKSGEQNWALLGTGGIAGRMAEEMEAGGRRFYSVGNRTREKAERFAQKHHVPKVYKDFSEMFTDDEVDIIYIATPHNTHIDFIIEALEHGKHVLAEKSITLNNRELDRAVRLAKKKQLVLAEAQTIYHMPVLKELRRRVLSGEFGAVSMIQVNFGSYKEYDMENRFYNKALAGGALLDIGVYAISLARYFMDSAPQEVTSKVRFAPSGADESSGIIMVNEQGQMAVLSVSLHAKQPKRAVISCDKAYIEIMEYPHGDEAVIVYTESGVEETVELGEQGKALLYEMEDMERAVSGDETVMQLPLTIDVMNVMTGIRKEWGMVYDSEKTV